MLCRAVLCRLVVLRLLTGLLFGMLGTMLLRYVVWGTVWLLTGSHFWILPNLMSETVSVTSLTFERPRHVLIQGNVILPQYFVNV